MKKNLYVRDDFILKTKTSEGELKQWEELKLIRPVGYTDDSVPLYSGRAIEQVQHIRKLLDMGYGLDEIREIVKKVGIPKGGQAHAEPKKPNQYLTVGNLAEQVGVSPRTIKHWEDKKIIIPDMRSEGGFRLYSGIYVYICKLIIDLQLFGYALEEIKAISDYFRGFLDIQQNMGSMDKPAVDAKLDTMLKEIQVLSDKMDLFKKGINRWEDLLKKKRKEILNLKDKNGKRPKPPKGADHA